MRPVIRPGILHRVLVAQSLSHGSFRLNRVVFGSVGWCVRGKEFAGLIVLVLTVRMLKAAYALSRQVDRLSGKLIGYDVPKMRQVYLGRNKCC